MAEAAEVTRRNMTLREKYPNAFEDEQGTVWTSQQAAEAADWSYAQGDGFLDEVIGWGWRDAEENWAICQQQATRRAFWKKHHRLRSILWWIRCRYGFASLFIRTVWRDWDGRISWSTAWDVSRGIWLEGKYQRAERKED